MTDTFDPDKILAETSAGTYAWPALMQPAEPEPEAVPDKVPNIGTLNLAARAACLAVAREVYADAAEVLNWRPNPEVGTLGGAVFTTAEPSSKLTVLLGPDGQPAEVKIQMWVRAEVKNGRPVGYLWHHAMSELYRVRGITPPWPGRDGKE